MKNNNSESPIYDLELTQKQWQFISEGNHSINCKGGAVRAGKTWIDFMYTIPSRIVERLDEDGLAFIFGVSKSTIERNILEPMRKKWGKKLIGGISNDNTARIFGETVYCIGDAKSNQEMVIRGTDIKYAYMDEATECNEDVFMLMLSRLDRDCSVLDLTYNPKSPNHWLKKLLDSYVEKGVDIFQQHFTIWDNPTLPQDFVERLCKQYEGTVFYDRYILGKWTNAEGIIYRKFADNPNKFILTEVPKDIVEYSCGIDFGGNISAHTFVLTGFTRRYEKAVVLEAEELRDENTGETLKIDAVELAQKFVEFCKRCEKKYPRCYFDANYDNADPVTARTLETYAIREHCRTELKPAWKTSIIDRISLTTRLIGSDRLFVMKNCKYLINSLKSCIWDGKAEDVRLDDGKTNDIDILDAFEYSIEKHSNDLLEFDNYYGNNSEGDIYAQFRQC